MTPNPSVEAGPNGGLAVSKQFYRAFELCRGNGLTSLDGKPSADIPSVVNLAFAIELALKASLLGYKKTSRSHDLNELYELLPDTDRDFIVQPIWLTARTARVKGDVA